MNLKGGLPYGQSGDPRLARRDDLLSGLVLPPGGPSSARFSDPPPPLRTTPFSRRQAGSSAAFLLPLPALVLGAEPGRGSLRRSERELSRRCSLGSPCSPWGSATAEATRLGAGQHSSPGVGGEGVGGNDSRRSPGSRTRTGKPSPSFLPRSQVRAPKRTEIPGAEGSSTSSESRGGVVLLNLKRKHKVCVWGER